MRNTIRSNQQSQQEWQKRKHFIFRLNLFFFITFALCSVLLFRLALLQIVESENYEEQLTQKMKRDIIISPIRGNIYDNQGFPIAFTVSAKSIFYRMEPGQKKEDYIFLAKQLEDIFVKYGDSKKASLPAAEIIKLMDVGIEIDGTKGKEASYTFLPRRIKTNLTQTEIAYISEHRDELKGIEITEESTRVYNQVGNQSIASQLVGYLRPYSVAMNQKADYLKVYKDKGSNEFLKDEYVGFDGLEFMYQNELRGKNGSKSYPVNSRAEIVGQVQLTPPVKGYNLQLTINKDVQIAAQKAIAEQIAYMKTAEAKQLHYPAMGKEAVAGYAVAIEVDSGKVIAMANYPDYDPNIWTGGIQQSDLLNIQYRYTNGTIMDRYPDFQDAKQRAKHPGSLIYLGSTMKPLTILLGLKEGLLTANESYYDAGVFKFGRDSAAEVKNSDKIEFGNLQAWSAIARSSNTFMASMVGNRMYLSSKYKTPLEAVTVWDSYMQQFGLGVLTESGLPGELPGIKEYFNEAKKGSPQSALIYASFGQQGKYTTLQLAQYSMMLANKGLRYKPQFVDKITTYDGAPVSDFKPELLGQIEFPNAYWDVVKKGMLDVNVNGYFDGFPYTLARKTGTSQQSVSGQLLENAVFISYAPADNPKLAVAVIVPEGGYGGWGAAPIARKIYDAYDQHIGLTGKPKLP